MIQIWRSDDRYQVAVSPPEGPYWRSTDPMTATEVLAKLSQLGCHSTDISDAVSAADPGWTLERQVSLERAPSNRVTAMASPKKLVDGRT